MNKLSKENKIIIGIVMVVLVLSVGYAIFSESINIGGTARASGEFNIIFNSVGTIKEEGSSGARATISENKKILTVNVPKLEYPSAYVEVPVVIKNVGSIKAILKGIETVGLDTTDIKVSYSGVTQDEELGTNEERNMKIKVTWDSASTTIVDNITFKVGLNYEQSNGGVTTTGQEQSDLFTWDRPGIVSGLSEKGIAEVKANGGHLVIPEGVTEIAAPSFNPETGEGALDKGFSPIKIGQLDINTATEEQILENSIITNVSFPSTLKHIGNMAFFGNSNLRGNLIIPSNVISVGDYSFASSSIDTLKIGNNVEIIGKGSFYGCINLSGELIIPDNVKEIRGNGKESGAFSETSITSLRLGNGIQIIGEAAFSGCVKLTGELIIPNSVTVIGDGAFSQTSITSLKIGNAVRTIGGSAFYGCSGLNGNLIIPDNVEVIGAYAFADNSILSIKFGMGLKTIGNNAFDNCTNLTGVLFIPDGVTKIDSRAFSISSSSNNKLTSVSISANTVYSNINGIDNSFYNRPTPTIR